MLKVWQMDKPGDRVATCPHTDAFMAGDRFGTVTKIGRRWLHVQMDSGRRRKFLIEGANGFDPRVPALRKA